MEEIWKPINGYEDRYSVSNLGRVKSICRIDTIGRFRKERILKPETTTHGYNRVTLFKNSKHKHKTVHQLVAEAFLEYIPCGMELVIDHINNIKTDNRLCNLQIVTQRQNVSRKTGYTSIYTGVYWHKYKLKWGASIGLNGKTLHLGYYTDEVEASEAYKKALTNYETTGRITVS